MPKGILEGSGPLARLRMRAGLTQVAAAVKLGITPQYLQRLEAGLHDPRTSLIPAISKVYNVTADAALRAIENSRRQAAA